MNRPLHPATARAARTFTPKYLKPVGRYCEDCELSSYGPGFVPVCGSTAAPILLVGEGPAFDEIAYGEGFVGAAGSMLTRVLKLIGRHREQYRIGNILSCYVPGFDSTRFPSAVKQCRYLDDAIDAHVPKVVVPMGNAALRRVLGLSRSKHVKMENFHGTVTRTDRGWVVPTYHPSHLQRGATNLMGVVAFDLARASDIAQAGWPADPGEVWLDPPVDWFRAWAGQYLAAVRQDPNAYPLAVDIETPDKGSDEGASIADDLSYKILRINFSAGPNEGLTVPFEEGYLPIVAEVLAAGGLQYMWFKGFDFPRLAAVGMLKAGDSARIYDCMWAWHALQSDLPQGLGFAAPFYSTWGAWKHLSDSAPVRYAAVDPLQTRRVGDGVIADLVKEGRWDVFARHMHAFHHIVLQPATDVGVPIDRARLAAFKGRLDTEASRLLDVIAAQVPADLCPRTPKEGLKRPPTAEEHTKARRLNVDGSEKKDPPDPLKMALYARAKVIEQIVLREVLVCKTCGKQEISVTHAHPLVDDPRPILVKEVASVTRWYWQEPFNPDSPQQLLAYAEAKGHQPGKAKHTNEPSMDRETLGRLWREHADPLYLAVMSYRGVGKVRGTYVVGTEKRLDAHDRVHPQFTFRPSTMRLSATNPNIQNVIADKDGKESLAAGFRSCVVARGREVAADSEDADA